MDRCILVVDDDPHIIEVIEFAVRKAGMKSRAAADGRAALAALAAGGFDLVILDIGMPEMDGLEVCREVRKSSDIPILFLSARDEEIDRILGLEIGGDDYVTKPFSPRELVARIKAILKRTAPAPAAPQGEDAPLNHGEVQLDPLRFRASFRGEGVLLTATEFAILKAFLAQPQRVFDRDLLISRAYGGNIHVSDRTIDSHIRHIRAKFEQLGCSRLIETVHGVGYRLAEA